MLYTKISIIINQLKGANNEKDKLGILKIHEWNLIWKKILYYVYADRIKFPSNIYKIDYLSTGNKSIDTNFGILDHQLTVLSFKKYLFLIDKQKIQELLNEFDKESQIIFNNILTKDLNCNLNKDTVVKIYRSMFS